MLEEGILGNRSFSSTDSFFVRSCSPLLFRICVYVWSAPSNSLLLQMLPYICLWIVFLQLSVRFMNSLCAVRFYCIRYAKCQVIWKSIFVCMEDVVIPFLLIKSNPILHKRFYYFHLNICIRASPLIVRTLGHSFVESQFIFFALSLSHPLFLFLISFKLVLIHCCFCHCFCHFAWNF